MSDDGPTGDEARSLIEAVFGQPEAEAAPIVAAVRKTSFAPWHHPVKQIVRDYQWADLTRRLMDDRPAERRSVLRYFTLPGADLLDVRVLADILKPFGSKIEYFGFDVGYATAQEAAGGRDERGVYFATESALRQSGRITDTAVILPDRLEDIARSGSQAANRLRQLPVFDAINIDACDHLGYVPDGRTNSVFDALERLLAHQLIATDPWLLFITTRANPHLLGAPAEKLQSAIHSNLREHGQEFAPALAACIDAEMQTLASDLSKTWSTQSVAFLKLFSIGLGKHLLQFFNGQHNHPAKVSFVSAFSYKVHQPEPDMVSLAFRIEPQGLRIQPPTAGSVSVAVALEPKQALGVVDRASRLWDIDAAVASTADVRNDAILGAARLLRSADYDLDAWSSWLAGLQLRPMQVAVPANL